jgi:hypothetical protein
VDESLLKETKDWSVYNWDRLFKELNVGDIIKNLTEQDIKDAITLMKIK